MRNKVIACLAGAVVVLMSAGGAMGAGQDRPPEWVKKPTPEELFAVFPGPALERGVGGKVVIECEVAVDGTLRACDVISETPEGLGFGAAARAIAPQFLMRPRLVDGKPVASEIRTTITFQPPPGIRPSRSVAQTSEGPVTFTRMGWAAAPTRAEVAAAFPQRASGPGYAIMECTFKADGALTNCGLRKESERGKGYGPAALKLAGRFRSALLEVNGKPIKGSKVLITVRFDPPGAADPGISSQIEWAERPASADLVYPAAARTAGIREGRGVIDCVVLADGRLGDCRTVEESPQGVGFGQAALALAPRFRVNPWADGRSMDGRRIKLPVQFVDDVAPAPAGG